MASLGASPACTLRAIISTTPPLTLLTIATSIEGILVSAQPKLLSEVARHAEPRKRAPRARVANGVGPQKGGGGEKKHGSAVQPSQNSMVGSLPSGSVDFWLLSSDVSTCENSPSGNPQIQTQPKCGRLNKTTGRSAVGLTSDYSVVANDSGDAGGR
jgi:hypothetical protein